MTDTASGRLLDNGKPRKSQIGTQILLDTYQALYGPNITISHLDDLARDLSQIAKRPRLWTGKYLHTLIKGYDGFSVSNELARALTILGSCLDGTDKVQARAHQAHNILTVHDLPAGTIILGHAQQCANPGCPVIFVATHPQQKYHSRACAKAARRLRRKSPLNK